MVNPVIMPLSIVCHGTNRPRLLVHLFVNVVPDNLYFNVFFVMSSCNRIPLYTTLY